MQPTDKTTITRLAKRGSYDTDTIYSILDEGLFCHVSYCLDNQPFIIPTGYARMENKLYLHGSVGSHFFRELAKGISVSVAVSLLDGLVLARSVFHHSVNYRSVVLFGNTKLVEDEAERWNSLEKFTEHMVPGRWNDARQPTASEMKKTMVLSIEIEEASAKMNLGGVNDEPEDLDLNVWAGVLPLQLQPAPPLPDAALNPEIKVPDYLKTWHRRKK